MLWLNPKSGIGSWLLDHLKGHRSDHHRGHEEASVDTLATCITALGPMRALPQILSIVATEEKESRRMVGERKLLGSGACEECHLGVDPGMAGSSGQTVS